MRKTKSCSKRKGCTCATPYAAPAPRKTRPHLPSPNANANPVLTPPNPSSAPACPPYPPTRQVPHRLPSGPVPAHLACAPPTTLSPGSYSAFHPLPRAYPQIHRLPRPRPRPPLPPPPPAPTSPLCPAPAPHPASEIRPLPRLCPPPLIPAPTHPAPTPRPCPQPPTPAPHPPGIARSVYQPSSA